MPASSGSSLDKIAFCAASGSACKSSIQNPPSTQSGYYLYLVFIMSFERSSRGKLGNHYARHFRTPEQIDMGRCPTP
jgi:hypothetical protein